jgi:glycosyltransferase involved in cell wall biosynthesis
MLSLEARRRLGPLGAIVAQRAERTEAWIARNASSVIAISEHFIPVHQRWGTSADKLHVIPNWGPLDEVQPRARGNEWARDHDLVGKPVLLYAGTLGLKHDPTHLLTLIRAARRGAPNAALVVVSDGPAADRLRESAEPGLIVLPFQPFDRLSDVLGSGDVLVTILEPEASNYSVPSKTLTYLCAGRPVLAVVPKNNPAYEIVVAAGGLASDPSELDRTSTTNALTALLANPEELARAGRLARAYAERNFDITSLTSLRLRWELRHRR